MPYFQSNCSQGSLRSLLASDIPGGSRTTQLCDVKFYLHVKPEPRYIYLSPPKQSDLRGAGGNILGEDWVPYVKRA